MKKVLCIILVFVLSFTLVSCGGVKFPSDKQVLEDIKNMRSMLSVDNQKISLQGSVYVDGYFDEAISFKTTEKPKTKGGYAYIRGILTLKDTGDVEVELLYRIFDDNSCEFHNVYQRR